MPLPELDKDGYLPVGIHAASLREALVRFAVGSPARQQRGELLRRIVEAAKAYPTIKRVLVWGSFVIDKLEPRDLDYSIVVGVQHLYAELAQEHRRFLAPAIARQFYGADPGYLVICDYPLELYIELVDFVSRQRSKAPCGIIEINLRGEVGERA